VPRPDRHLLAAVLALVLALAGGPLLAGGTGTGASATTASVTARAASTDEPVAAPDQRWPVAGEAVQTAVRLADGHWGGPACQGRVELVWTTLAEGTNATASWRNPTHAWDNAGENFDCRVELSAAADYDWPKLCTVLTHELGHLHGRQHDDGDVVMATVYRAPLAACEATPEPGAPAPVAEPEEELEPAVAAPAKPKAATSAKRVVKRLTAAQRAAKARRARAAARARARARAAATRARRA
jgi:hypothetical protein